jgi:hypothetical protein
VNRVEERLSLDFDGQPRRGVYFYDGPNWPVRSGWENGYLFRDPRGWGTIIFSDQYRSAPEDYFAVPAELLRAFEAGEPIEPILDYLIETYAHARPWLVDAVARVCATEGAAT